MNRRLIIAAGTTAALMVGTLPAAASDEGYYVSGTGGFSFNPDLQFHSPLGRANEQTDTGYAYGGAVGYDTGDGKRIEIDSLYTHNDISKLGGAPATGHVSATSLMLNGQIDLTQDTDLTPYAGAGIGFQNVGASVAGFHGHDLKPAYQLEAGLRKDVSDNMSLFGEYRFSQSEAGQVSNAGIDGHQRYSDHGLLAGVTYHLGD